MEKKPLLSLPRGFTDRTLVTARLAGKLVEARPLRNGAIAMHHRRAR